MSNYKILIIAPDTSGEGIRKAFLAKGHKVNFHMYKMRKDIPVTKKLLNKRKYRAREVEKDFNRILSTQLEKEIAHQQPDFILVIKGEMIYKSSHKILQQVKVPIVLWTIDSLSRYPSQNMIASYADFTFYQDGGDVTSDHAKWLPLGIDEGIFKPASEKIFDILFIGYLRQPDYQDRLDYLKLLLDSHLVKDYKVGLVVGFGSRFVPGFVKKSGATYLGRLPMISYAEYIAQSRVCINIHQSDGIQPINPAFFGIPACKSCQMVDHRAYLGQWLRPNRDYLETNKTNFINDLDTLMKDSHKISEVADNAFQSVIPEHTHLCRVDFILNNISSIFTSK